MREVRPTQTTHYSRQHFKMIIWITGASTGIGRELARQYAEAGNIVFATARSQDNLNSLVEQSAAYEGSITALPGDVCDAGGLSDLFETIISTVGAPDLVVLNAGTHKPTSGTDFVLEDHLRLMDINFNGVLNGLNACLPSMLERRTGQIAVVASVAGYRGLPRAGAYGASKAGLINLCESMKPELEEAGIDLRVVCPGFIKTPLTDLNDFPMPFLMPVDKAVKAMIKGLKGKKFQIVFPWQMGIVMQILRRMPNWLFFSITRKISG